MQIMRHNDLGFLLDRPGTGPSFRKLLLGTVLATDMGVHFDFMAEFERFLQGAEFPELRKRVLVCQALIKCADISNPVSLASCQSRGTSADSHDRADPISCRNTGPPRSRRSGAVSCFLRSICSYRRL